MERLICRYFKSDCHKAIAVARCESGLNPMAYNHGGYYGLFQMGRGWAYRPPTAWVRYPNRFFIPEVNVKAAYQLWRSGGWSHWACA